MAREPHQRSLWQVPGIDAAVPGIAVTGWDIQANRDRAESERNLVVSLDEIHRLVGEYNYPAAYAIAETLDSQITDDSNYGGTIIQRTQLPNL